MTKQVSFVKGISIGDTVKAHRKGIHRVVDVEARYIHKDNLMYHPGKHLGDQYNSLIRYRQIAREDGTPINGRTVYACDESYCHVYTRDLFQKKIKELQEKQEAIKELMEQLLGPESNDSSTSSKSNHRVTNADG